MLSCIFVTAPTYPSKEPTAAPPQASYRGAGSSFAIHEIRCALTCMWACARTHVHTHTCKHTKGEHRRRGRTGDRRQLLLLGLSKEREKSAFLGTCHGYIHGCECQYQLGSLDLSRNAETHAGVCLLICPLRGLVWMKKPFRDSA